MTKQEFAKVVQAWADGETIEWKERKDTEWNEDGIDEAPIWGIALDYRIKPKETTTMRFAYVRPNSIEQSNIQNDSHNLKLIFTNNFLTEAKVLR